jgi:hypothetical protein
MPSPASSGIPAVEQLASMSGSPAPSDSISGASPGGSLAGSGSLDLAQDVVLLEQLGSGAFGTVYRGGYRMAGLVASRHEDPLPVFQFLCHGPGSSSSSSSSVSDSSTSCCPSLPCRQLARAAGGGEGAADGVRGTQPRAGQLQAGSAGAGGVAAPPHCCHACGVHRWATGRFRRMWAPAADHHSRLDLSRCRPFSLRAPLARPTTHSHAFLPMPQSPPTSASSKSWRRAARCTPACTARLGRAAAAVPRCPTGSCCASRQTWRRPCATCTRASFTATSSRRQGSAVARKRARQPVLPSPTCSLHAQPAASAAATPQNVLLDAGGRAKVCDFGERHQRPAFQPLELP